MDCPSCDKETAPDSFFCHWCSAFIPAPEKGVKAGLLRRYFALALDPVIAYGLYFIGIALFGGVTGGAGAIAAALMLPFAYLIWWLSLFRKGQTPGKKLLNVQVVHSQSGIIPGFGKMFVREVIGKLISGLFLGLGYFWALFDKNNQAWHDKLAGTVVIKATGRKKAPSYSQQQSQQQIEAEAAVAELPAESSATDVTTNVDKAEHPTEEDIPPQTHLGHENFPQQASPSRRKNSGEQSSSEDQSQSSSRDGPEEEWIGDEYWRREDDDTG
jgi:uncharacterized RDD family membrane protein YckC